MKLKSDVNIAEELPRDPDFLLTVMKPDASALYKAGYEHLVEKKVIMYPKGRDKK